MEKEELCNVKIEWTECTICLLPLFCDDGSINIDQQLNQMYEQDGYFNVTNSNGNSRRTADKCKRLLGVLYRFLFEFNEYRTIEKKPFILTPCQHAFHAKCLESWLREKRECPTDRTPIPVIEM